MTPDLLDHAALIASLMDRRVELWRTLIGPDGKPTGERIYRGYFYDPPLTAEERGLLDASKKKARQRDYR